MKTQRLDPKVVQFRGFLENAAAIRKHFGGLTDATVDRAVDLLRNQNGTISRARYSAAQEMFRSDWFIDHASQVALAAARDFVAGAPK